MIRPEALVLVNIPDAALTTRSSTYRGTLVLECVTIEQIPDSETPTRDAYLVLRIDSFKTPLDPFKAIQCSTANGFRQYSLSDGNGEDVTVDLLEPSKHESHLQEDLHALDTILAQYDTKFRGPQNPAFPRGFQRQGWEDLRGHFVLVNEDSGEIVGEVENQITVQEDPSLNEKGREREPVIIEIPEDGDDMHSIFVRAIPPEEHDVITRSAWHISYAISGTTDRLLTAITGATSYFIKNSEPHPSTSTSSSASSSDPLSSCSALEKLPFSPRSGSDPKATDAIGTKDRLILSASLVLSTIEDSAKKIRDVAAKQLNAIIEHKYGAEAARSTALWTGTAQNILLFYIDMNGIARIALIKRAGTEYVKNRFSNKSAL